MHARHSAFSSYNYYYYDYYGSALKQQITHDVISYGAVGDGITDDSKAFQLAWKAACTEGSDIVNITFTVPSGKTFLVSPTSFEGPCTSRSITFEILGKILAPERSAWTWENRRVGKWLSFHLVNGLNLIGNGLGQIDGQGQSWWGNGGSGFARNISFSEINFIESDNPVIIDQLYCPHKTCGDQIRIYLSSIIT
ncbi:hypothetical protein ACJIZ3_025556 [Penstemon smallii]|uniref:Polygalacturonase n=1 Tax=Penstemon smallii TaxID=265156 RepID=A0ABD3TVA7_9LAMI